MKKINSLKKNEDFERIIHSSKSYRFRDCILYLEWNGQSSYHFGLSVGKKIGNAVVRNLYKRRLRNIIDKKDYKNGFNCIIILRNTVLNRSYQEFEEDLLGIFSKLKMIKEQENE